MNETVKLFLHLDELVNLVAVLKADLQARDKAIRVAEAARDSAVSDLTSVEATNRQNQARWFAEKDEARAQMEAALVRADAADRKSSDLVTEVMSLRASLQLEREKLERETTVLKQEIEALKKSLSEYPAHPEVKEARKRELKTKLEQVKAELTALGG